MSGQRMDRESGGRRRERSFSSDSDDGSSRRQYHQRASHRNNDRDYVYNESMPGRRRQHRSRSPIIHPRDVRRNSLDPSRSPRPHNRPSRNEHERRRRKLSFTSDHHGRDSRDDYKRPRLHDLESRSSPRRGLDRESREPHRHRARNKSTSHSPSRHHVGSLPAQTSGPKRSHAPLPSQQDAFSGKSLSKSSKQDLQAQTEPPPEKQKPNYTLSGRLAAETNTVANTSIILKYNEPPGGRLPPTSSPWRLYIFKGDSLLETLPVHTRSCWLFGRERLAVDCPIEHPSCSKQHAVIQFRSHEVKNEYGDKEGGVRPYIIDLQSANGTKVNGEAVPERRYVELKDKDVITFGESTREYVLILPPKE